MAARAAVRSLLGNDSLLISIGLPLVRWFSSASADTPLRDGLWGVIKWLDTTQSFGVVSVRPMEVWLYQPREMGRDYGVIDTALEHIRSLLTTAEQVAGGDGWTLSGASWEMDSADLTDEGFNALTKFARFRVAARPLITP